MMVQRMRREDARRSRVFLAISVAMDGGECERSLQRDLVIPTGTLDPMDARAAGRRTGETEGGESEKKFCRAEKREILTWLVGRETPAPYGELWDVSWMRSWPPSPPSFLPSSEILHVLRVTAKRSRRTDAWVCARARLRSSQHVHVSESAIYIRLLSRSSSALFSSLEWIR